MRKQWTVQTGAGSSCGLNEFAGYYKDANDYVSEMLAGKPR
jgi:hypothetical protein